ncbi:hypothetical protein [Candidatus Harpocratesius sp.]
MVIFPIIRLFLLWLFAVLVFITTIQRFLHVYRRFYIPTMNK